MKDSWDKVFRSLLWELQVPRGRWNARMRWSLFHSPFLFLRFRRGEGKCIEDLRGAKGEGRCFLRPRRSVTFALAIRLPKRRRSGSCILNPRSIYCYRFFLFHFLWKAWQIFPAAAVLWSADRGKGMKEYLKKYIDSDIIGCHVILKNALLLLIPIFWYIDTDIKNAEWTMISANKFRTIVKFWLDSCFFSLAKLRKVSKIIIDAYGSTERETMDMSPFPWGWAKGG